MNETISTTYLSAVIIGILCLVMSHWFKSKENTHTQEKIYVYNWGEYIDPSLIKSSKTNRHTSCI